MNRAEGTLGVVGFVFEPERNLKIGFFAAFVVAGVNRFSIAGD